MRKERIVWAVAALGAIGAVGAQASDPVPVPGATMGSVSVRVGEESLTMPYRLMEPSEADPQIATLIDLMRRASAAGLHKTAAGLELDIAALRAANKEKEHG